MGAGIAQVVAVSGRRVSSRRRAGSDRARPAGMRKSLQKLAEKRGADPDEVLERVSAVDDLVAADLPIEAVIEDAAVKVELFPACRRAAPGRGCARLEHFLDPDYLARRGDRPARPRNRHALLQPGAGAEAVEVIRAPTRTSDETAAAITACSPRSPARCRRRRTTSPASSRTGS